MGGLGGVLLCRVAVAAGVVAEADADAWLKEGGPARAFRTADLWLIHAADCCSRYSSWTCCGVRY